ncbi:MAG: hypothetical protein JSS83_27650 [Cyanobacteria bacterium SZAS LIN-3]|nr:hypothetical protein [Cyanobacteria bacterium SZAS LIN-3]MBS2007368.1 hypothetical protein [Cyanobacteria bacterium SZAS TMP-1]
MSKLIKRLEQLKTRLCNRRTGYKYLVRPIARTGLFSITPLAILAAASCLESGIKVPEMLLTLSVYKHTLLIIWAAVFLFFSGKIFLRILNSIARGAHIPVWTALIVCLVFPTIIARSVNGFAQHMAYLILSIAGVFAMGAVLKHLTPGRVRDHKWASLDFSAPLNSTWHLDAPPEQRSESL